MGEHIINEQFQSDKYTWCKPGFVPLKLTDPMAWPVLAMYGELRRDIDSEFANDLGEALGTAGMKICAPSDFLDWFRSGAASGSKQMQKRVDGVLKRIEETIEACDMPNGEDGKPCHLCEVLGAIAEDLK